MHKAFIRGSKRIYGFLLTLYPTGYRQEFGEEIKYVFSESLKDAYTEQGAQGIITLWARILIDAGKSLVTQHIEHRKGGDSMKTSRTPSSRHNKNIIRIVLAAVCILLLPLLAMLMTDEVAWDLADFAVAYALLVSTGLMYELAARKVGNIQYRAAISVVLVAALFLVWTELAVGIFGT